MIDKSEMERVWQQEPVGWLHGFNKRTRNAKKFEITVKPYVKQYLEPVTKIVYAKNLKQAQYERPVDELRAKYPEHYQESEHGNYWFPKKEFATEISIREVK